jgi:hypothetical protein
MFGKMVRSRGGKLALVLLAIFVLSGFLRAQGDNPGPYYSFSGTDNGCVNSTTCNTVGGCTEYPFRPGVSGNYQYHAWVTCSSGECSHCVACVRLYDAMPPYNTIPCGTDENCESGGCRQQCQNVSLVGGHPYIMKVCLLSCVQSVLCADCENCTAHGCITNTGSCPE